MARVIIVGSGIAGLATALHATLQHGHEVTLVTKGELAESNTRYAQGGIAAATALDDSATLHADDTIRAGAGLTDETAARVLADEGAAAIQSLIEWGVLFDRRPGSSEPDRALEAAHSRPRVLHAGGDATGAAIETALVAAVRASGVAVHEHTMLTDLVLADATGVRARSAHPLPVDQAPMRPAGADAGERVVGIKVLRADGEREVLPADAVVLATGGAGQLYSHTTNPAIATGDGLAAALRAGVATADLEFYQFHPTTLAAPSNFLVSEAVRGEGAVLRNERGERFMLGVHPDAELAPRDVVARAIAAEMAKQSGVPVNLDARGIGRETLAERFPTIMAACAAAGFDLAGGLVPVVPAAHYYMGGIETDLDGRTSHAGLFAVGEAARTGVHGANRLASNSLLEGAVFARRVAAALGGLDTAAGGLLDQREVDSRLGQSSSRETTELRRSSSSATTELRRSSSRATKEPAYRDHPRAGLDTAAGGLLDQRSGSGVDRSELQALMWSYAGLTRSGVGLATAAARLRVWAEASTVRADDREQIETANLLVVARALVDAAQARRESRGAHARSDFPQTDSAARRRASLRDSSGTAADPSGDASPDTALTLQTQGH
ncbi:FAD-binding protein [Agreia sp. VKM Ac-1783]|uniref:L-aspartate oxidase n=1 Tax=Agreia sp. VKM Ac-1783 TaxID=1938889 RepID=UPI000A2ADF9A|nr:FAD-binding protein [Agreia sp. VKM Ac-1783]SMQ75015.1 L-aspartate oxidase [Agreia sp. VKM Ac-1783]